MICGYCSSEQPISDTCRKCQKAVVKITGLTFLQELTIFRTYCILGRR